MSDEFSEDGDLLNDETFGCAETGDWEFEHERFAIHEGHETPSAPSADKLPKFWESTDDMSLLWSADSLEAYAGMFDDSEERGVDVEQTLQNMLLDDEKFEDPAIIDISRKVSGRNLRSATLENFLTEPTYWNTNNIWSINKRSSFAASAGKRAVTGSSDSINLLDLLKQLRKSTTATSSTTSKVDRSTSCLNGSSDDATKILGPSSFKNSLGSSTSTVSASIPPEQQQQHLQPNSMAARLPPNSLADGLVPSTSSHTYQLLKSRIDAFPSHVQPPHQTPNAQQSIPMSPGFFTQPPFPQDPRTLQLFLLNAQKAQFNARCSDRLPIPSTFMLPPPSTGQPLIPPSQTLIPFVRPGVLTPANILGHPPLPLGMLVRGFPNVRPPSPAGVYASVKTHTTNNIQLSAVDTDSDETFDVDAGSWMTKFECVGVLLANLRPLIVSNPYVQDYYFIQRWLRQMTVMRAKQIAAGNIPYTAPLPIMHVPSPVSLINLIDPSHHHQLTPNYKLTMPLTLIPSLCQPHSPTASSQSDGASTPTQVDPPQDMSLSPAPTTTAAATTTTTTANSTALGRPTFSSINRPHMLAEISLSSVLWNDVHETEVPHKELPSIRENDGCVDGNASTTTVHSSILLKSDRRRRLLLARIERMYALLLNVDEVDVALARVPVQNETQTRLFHHRTEMLFHLIGEFFCNSSEAQASSITPQLYLDQEKCMVFLNLLSIRKGIRLFSVVLNYIPQNLINICVRAFVLHYEVVQKYCLAFEKECSSVLYPNLRRALYKTTNIESLMHDCFPDLTDKWMDDAKSSTRITSLISTNLGLTLIFCFLDLCARLSRPDDPSNFVRYAAYFAYQTITYQSQSGHVTHPIESFPHLASIVSIYVQADDKNKLLSSNHIKLFRCLIHDSPSAEPVSPRSFRNESTIATTTPTTPNSSDSSSTIKLSSTTLPSVVNTSSFPVIN